MHRELLPTLKIKFSPHLAQISPWIFRTLRNQSEEDPIFKLDHLLNWFDRGRFLPWDIFQIRFSSDQSSGVK
jgi:hypothetical protein